MLAGPEPAGGRLIGWPATGEAEISVEALLEILEAVFEGIAEWRKERAEEGGGAQETVVLGGQQDGSPGNDPYSYQLGGRPQGQDGQQATPSRRGIRQ